MVAAREMQEDDEITGIFFDGRKDFSTLCRKQDPETGKYFGSTIREEHVSVLSEPGGVYLTRFTPDSGTGKDLAKGLHRVLEENGSLDKVEAIGCDSTAANTDHQNGVIRELERLLGRPLQGLICQLHTNELPLRHLIELLDGPTSGANTFAGPIRRRFSPDLEQLQIVKFTPIAFQQGLPNLPEEVVQDLSWDQNYLFEICAAIVKGHVQPELAKRKLGRMSHSRWLTTAARLCRLYVSVTSTDAIASSLYALTSYVVVIYARQRFSIRFLAPAVRTIALKYAQKNAYFAYPEHLLVTMLNDDEQHIRSNAVQLLLEARKKEVSGIRKYEIPALNFEARSYHELISWDDTEISFPPVLQKFSDEELNQMVFTKLNLIRYPCHTQAVERCVKTVTNASEHVCGFDRRDGYARATIASGIALPSFKNNKDFVAK